jgi:hypothetical protein
MIQTFDTPWATVAVDNTAAIYFPDGNWRPCAGIVSARARLELGTMVGAGIEVAAAIQVCNFTDTPGATTAISAYLTSVDVQYPTDWTSLTTALQGAQLFRPGFLVKRTSGTALVIARVQAAFEFNNC